MNSESEIAPLLNYLEFNALAAQQNKILDRNLSIVHGIGVTEFTVMHSLQHATRNTMSRIDLATSIGLSASGVTRLLNPMEKIGLVEKEKNARDARVSLVKLSVAGHRVYLEALVTANEVCTSFYTAFTSKQGMTFKELVTLLKKS